MRRLEEIARFVGDVDAAVAFYRTLLEEEPASWRPGETAVFMLGDVALFLHRRSEGMPGGPRSEDHISFAVEEVDRACDELRRAGVAIAVAPQDYYWGRSAYLRIRMAACLSFTRHKANPDRLREVRHEG